MIRIEHLLEDTAESQPSLLGIPASGQNGDSAADPSELDSFDQVDFNEFEFIDDEEFYRLLKAFHETEMDA